MDIKVLGPGCPKCLQVEKVVKQTIEEVGVKATVEKVTDIEDIQTVKAAIKDVCDREQNVILPEVQISSSRCCS